MCLLIPGQLVHLPLLENKIKLKLSNLLRPKYKVKIIHHYKRLVNNILKRHKPVIGKNPWEKIILASYQEKLREVWQSHQDSTEKNLIA